MTMDFIIDLPPCKCYDSISVYIDRGYKLIFISPTNKTVDSIGSADIFMHNVYPYTGLPEQLITDRGTQFAS